MAVSTNGRMTAPLMLASILTLGIAGCAAIEPLPRARQLDLAAFSTPDAAAGARTAEEEGAGSARAGADPEADRGDREPRPGLGAGGFSPPSSESAATARPVVIEPGDRLIIDSMVGQVNGRPIFADAFFRPIEDQLRRDRASSPTLRDFAMKARDTIAGRLRDVVINALVLAEAETGLTQQQQVGILAWLRNLQEAEIARNESEAETRARILAEQGVSLEDYLQGQRDYALIQNLLRERIRPRVIVSWWDIERRYQQRIRDFQPPATATISRILLGTDSQADAIASVKERLAAGEDFAEVGASLGASYTILAPFEAPEGDVAQSDIWSDEIKAQLAGLHAPGDTVGPFMISNGAFTLWLHLVSVDQPPGRSLYDADVQRAIAARLREERSAEEQRRYLAQLLEKGIYDDLRAMEERLNLIALAWYGR